ncbi:CDP-diacylglycerol--glycerol-3-phosphate 3-phosphatidyltransferase [Rhizohabitans arisaemae]|uniref:CDP-diacylglycerol--glycerol-3-phosphate 3-phosphatidyltransferase n=1 Tax=Rhizohabitans arisaemae TaxID=2720610 RepID=UPI0024B1033E|nr:CDP-diacylglycerol--glycerol-3-phosphate 3-phosphatidyltransferase [Rhizohabitans arisaemae]
MNKPPRAGADPLATPPARQVSVVNIANAVTVVRLILVPVFIVFLFQDGGGWRIAALAVFAVASLTDRLDGELARRRGLVTDFGKIADPIADKALIGGALIGLSLLYELPWWVTIVILVREIGITLVRFIVIRYGVIPASYGGKVKTALQVVAIGLFIAPGIPGVVRWAAMGAAVAVTVVTGLDYLVRAWRLSRGS